MIIQMLTLIAKYTQGFTMKIFKNIVIFISIILISTAAYQYLMKAYGISEITFIRDIVLQRLGIIDPLDENSIAEADKVTLASNTEDVDTIALDRSIEAFKQIGESLDFRAHGHDFFALRGATIFDANDDGRLDLFFPHPGRTVARKTDENHILKPDERMDPIPASLFLNQGNNAEGDPIFMSVQQLQQDANTTLVESELLFENKYRPRKSINESEANPGRISWGAVSADFNGDGRNDLYILNVHYGLLHQTDELGLPVYPTKDAIGRDAKRDPLVLRLPSFLWVDQDDGYYQTVYYGEQPEPEGRNTLLINLGDQDNDGIPEWQDVTEQTGVGGRAASMSAAIADYDRDGDLDIYVANFHDTDYFGFGDDRFAGQRNQLYQNQLAETGEFVFKDVAVDLKIAGLHEQEQLAASVYFPSKGEYVDTNEQIVAGRPVGEKADHSWSATFVDLDNDNWLDLVVANDISNRIRIYKNRAGRAFEYFSQLNDSIWDGCWMGMSAGDLNGDLKEELVATNCGSQVMSARNTALMIEDEREANIQALAVINYPKRRSTLNHEIFTIDDNGDLQTHATKVSIEHSPYIPPNLTKRQNFSQTYSAFYDEHHFATSLTGLEFAWNVPMFDIDNDGDLDLYFAGSLMRGNDNFIGDWSGSPGRLLVNQHHPMQKSSGLKFKDMTVEYQLLDITDMDYRHNPPRRPAPGTGWHKRDYIYLTDTSAYSGMGMQAADQSETADIFKMHEAAYGVYAADLNNDGFQDIVVTHGAGYNSISPDAKNLKVEFAGRVLAVPSPNKIMKPPTNFQRGETFVYINTQKPNAERNWIKIRLIDRAGFNLKSVGAKVIVNQTQMRRVNATNGAVFGSSYEDLHIGLGNQSLQQLDIVWPWQSADTETITFDQPIKNQTVCIIRDRGLTPCDSLNNELIEVTAKRE